MASGQPAMQTFARRIARAAFVLGIAGAIAGLAAAASSHFSIHPRFRLVGHGGESTDGRYTILWSGRRVRLGTLLDETTGQRTSLTLPQGCRRPTGESPDLGDSWLLAYCGRTRVELYSLTSGSWQSVTVAPACQHFRGSCTPLAVGTDWIEYDEFRTRFGDRSIFQNIATGAVRRDPTNRTTLPNLDTPALAQPVCPPLRVPRLGTLKFDGQFAVAILPTGTFLERCGTRLHRFLTDDQNPAVTSTTIMWMPAPNRPLRGIFLPSLREFTVAPPPHTNMVFLDLSSRHLYVVGFTPSDKDDVWSAPAPELLGASAPQPHLSRRSAAHRGQHLVRDVARGVRAGQ